MCEHFQEPKDDSKDCNECNLKEVTQKAAYLWQHGARISDVVVEQRGVHMKDCVMEVCVGV